MTLSLNDDHIFENPDDEVMASVAANLQRDQFVVLARVELMR